MPQLGETVTEGTIIKWLKNVGDTVAHDEPLFEVSTDKVDSEVPSSAEGVITEILVPEGATVDIGTRLAVIGGAGAMPESPPAAPEAEVAAPAVAQAPAAPAEAEVAVAQPAAVAAVAAPAVAQPAAPANTQGGAGTGSTSRGSGPGLLLSPVVRKLLDEHGLDPAVVKGTGQGGRITRGDVLGYLDAQAAAGSAAGGTGSGGAAGTAGGTGSGGAPGAPGAPGAAGAAARSANGTVRAPAFPAPAPGERDEVVPFTNIRRLTAEHMVRSKATSAHTLTVIEADYEAIEKVRRKEKDRFKEVEGVSLSYLPFVARAVVDVLRDYPELNASVGEDSLIIHRDVHLGIAVDLDRQGLIVPVVRQADGQSLRGLARAIADLADRARSRRLSADDVVGGTFTITNPGPFGTFMTGPIINQPQVAVLSTDGVKRRPVVVAAPDGSEAIAIHSVGLLALSFDHRAVDGAYASAFLRDLSNEISNRDWASEL